MHKQSKNIKIYEWEKNVGLFICMLIFDLQQ